MDYSLSSALVDGVLILGLSSCMKVRLSAGTGSALHKSDEPSAALLHCLTFLSPSIWGNNDGNDTLETNVGKCLWITPLENLTVGNIFIQNYMKPDSQKQHTTVPLLPVQIGVPSGALSKWVCKEMQKSFMGVSEDGEIPCLVRDNLGTKRNWLALITACLPSGCCRVSCSKDQAEFDK